jgi:hypothetical protein
LRYPAAIAASSVLIFFSFALEEELDAAPLDGALPRFLSAAVFLALTEALEPPLATDTDELMMLCVCREREREKKEIKAPAECSITSLEIYILTSNYCASLAGTMLKE